MKRYYRALKVLIKAAYTEVAEFVENPMTYKRRKKLRVIEGHVRKALIKKSKQEIMREVEQMILKDKINRHMNKYLRVGARSRFIPAKLPNPSACRQEVYGRFGDDMEKCGLILTEQLKFETCTL
ncbi:hypothetical protein ACLI1A_10120 [Flavobacterium sp. RHBU_3]|uniref:hypothetical protein n=1 Tax=Flavobacterium sp. RHBU_3 TaxID=3391184 RepID=UPI003984DC69